jgi:hypothetical protein
LRKLMIGSSAALIFSVGIATAVAATEETPVVTGCPAAYQALTVEEWEQLDARYKLPAEIDDANLTPEPDGAPFDGVPGNADGIVCGRALPEGFTFGWAEQANGIPSNEAPDIFYDFRDNDSRAQQ